MSSLPAPLHETRPSGHDAASAAPRGALAVVSALAVIKLALHLATTGRFGYELFVDELYFLDCSRHLAWGYVDMPPLFPFITALVRALVGESLLAVRILPALSGAATVFLTGLLAIELGGRRLAPWLASLALLTAPIYLCLNSLHTMNQLEPILWTASALVLAKLSKGGDPRLWLVFGAISGIGLLNKHSMAFFGAAVVVAVLLTPERRAFRGPWLYLAGGVALLLFLPNLAWEVQHRFPHLEMLANIKRNGRDVALSPLAFVAQQVVMLNPLAAPLWIGGLLWLLFEKDGRRFRILGLTYVALIGEMLLLDGRVYYPAPVYPILFAAGAVGFEHLLAERRGRGALAFLASALVIASGALLAPLAFPCLPPEVFVRYSKALHLTPPPIETHRLGPLPQLLADRFGWKEMTETVAGIYRRLPEGDREKATIFGQNYGQAGAINHYGPALGLPRCISGHLSHWYWGPQGASNDVVIVMDDDRETLERLFSSVELAGRVRHPYSMPYQQFDVYVCRSPKGWTWESLWPRLKKWN